MVMKAINWVLKILRISDERLLKVCLIRMKSVMNNCDRRYNWLSQLAGKHTMIKCEDIIDTLDLQVWLDRREEIVRKYREYVVNIDFERY